MEAKVEFVWGGVEWFGQSISINQLLHTIEVDIVFWLSWKYDSKRS